MKNLDEYVKTLYLSDEYILKHPSLHQEDSPWKVDKIIPLVDRFISNINKEQVNLLDVGGGGGLILKMISTYIEESYGIKVNKFAVDLSPGMLENQKKVNPDIKKALNESIHKTSLANKEIDLCLMIDLLEHVPNPTEALEEIRRISRFVIFKVPLEDNLFLRTRNFVSRGKAREKYIENLGHINVYNFGKLKYEIEKHTGQILDFYYTNVFDYHAKSGVFKKGKVKMRLIKKWINFIAKHLFRLSPKLCSRVFNDFVMILAKCG